MKNLNLNEATVKALQEEDNSYYEGWKNDMTEFVNEFLDKYVDLETINDKVCASIIVVYFKDEDFENDESVFTLVLNHNDETDEDCDGDMWNGGGNYVDIIGEEGFKGATNQEIVNILKGYVEEATKCVKDWYKSNGFTPKTDNIDDYITGDEVSVLNFITFER